MALLLALATEQECRAACPGLTTCPPEHELAPYRLAGREILLCITGVGPINASIAMGRALAQRGDISTVWNIGLAGSFDLALAPLGSVWLVREEIYPEYGLVADMPGADARALGFAQYADVWDRLPLPVAGDALPQAASLTVAGVTNSPVRAAALYARYKSLLENMEGFAVALACLRAGIACHEARVVSNLVGSRAPEHRAFAAALDRLPHLVHTLFATTSDSTHA